MITEFREGSHLIVKPMSDHNHSADTSLKYSIMVKNTLKHTALTSSEPPAQIIQTVLASVPSSSACSTSNRNSMRQMIQRARKATKPKEPSTLEEINFESLSDDYTTVEGELFLARDVNYGDGNRLLIFCTNSNLRILRNSPIWIMDGTFRTCPSLFKQLYSIHALVGYTSETRRTIPVVYCLMTDKKEETYQKFLQELKLHALQQLELELSPQHILTDFEISMINVVRIEFPNANHHGCLFHLGQNLWRHIQKSGFAGRYGNDCDFALKLRQLIALAYLPPEKIPDSFKLLKANILPNEAEAVTNWFETYYVLGQLKSHVDKVNGNKEPTSVPTEPVVHSWSESRAVAQNPKRGRILAPTLESPIKQQLLWGL